MELKPGYKRTEVGVIPEEWEVKPLKQLSPRQCVGVVVNSSSYFADDGTVPFLVGSNVGENSINWGTAKRITDASNQLLGTSRLAAGDLVTVRVGEPGVTAVIPPDLDGCNCASMMIVRQHPSFDSHWLCCVMNSRIGRLQVEHVQYGTAQKQFNISDAVDFCYPVPPLSEQRAIAGALGVVDALLGTLTQLIAKKRDLKQAAMQQLLTGQERLPCFTGQWEAKLLGECLRSLPDYGINAPGVPYSDRLPAYIRITDISDDGRFRPEKPVSVGLANAENYYLSEGDLVFARTGASVGKSYLYKQKDGPLVFAGFLIRVRPDPNLLNASYLSAYVTTDAYWNWVRLMSMRSGQPGINGNEFAQLPLRLPPLPEQTAIAGVLSDMDAELAALEQRLDKTRALKQGMMQELLTGRTRLV